VSADPLHFPLQRRLGEFSHQTQVVERFGERGRNRTYNLLIKSQLLCQLSYAPVPLFSVNYGRCHLVKSGIVS
jgi:hypothetical protein